MLPAVRLVAQGKITVMFIGSQGEDIPVVPHWDDSKWCDRKEYGLTSTIAYGNLRSPESPLSWPSVTATIFALFLHNLGSNLS